MTFTPWIPWTRPPSWETAQSVSPSFAHIQPAYQSVNLGHLQTPQNEHNRLTATASDYNISSYGSGPEAINASEGKQKSGLLKWKGITLPPEDLDSSDHSEDEEAADVVHALPKSHRMKVKIY